MRRLLSAALALTVLASCQDTPAPTASDPAEVSEAISDGTGTVGDVGEDPDLQGNPHFFWLSPMVSEPDHELFGTFDPTKRPTLRIVCREDSDPNAVCDPDAGLATFTVGDGLIVEDDHYKAEFDTREAGLRTSAGETDFTTYRIEVLTPPLGDFGGPFVIGFADFQVAENGQARNLDGGDGDPTIELKDGRTLPIRFRLDEGVLEEELEVNSEPTDDATGEEAFCQINCSVTVIDRDQDTEASLTDDQGEEITAMLIPAGTTWSDETSVLVIDERVDDGDTEDGELCLPGGELRTEACFRYELSPDNPDGNDFTEPVRFGICPEGQAVSGGSILPTWRLLKADLVDDEVVISRPDEVDVSDFLACDVSRTVTLWDGPGGRLAGSALQWLVSPARASDWWGGQLQDLSDLFWGEDVEMSAVTGDSTATVGDTLLTTVRLAAVHPDPDQPVEDAEVTFSVTGDAGSALAVPATSTAVGTPTSTEATLLTDASGEATIGWIVEEGANRLEVTSPDARPADGEPDPLAFEVTGLASAAFADVATASGHSCGLTADGRVFCWGANGSGQLGDGSTTASTTPVRVASGETFTSVDAAGRSTCAVADDGVVHCWGDNTFGQLGDGTTTGRSSPVPVDDGITTFTSVDVGFRYACGIGGDGTTYCWGDDGNGELGDGTGATSSCGPDSTPCSPTPQPVSSAFTTVSAGIFHTCALEASAEAFCWGRNTGSFGDGAAGSEMPSPVTAFDGFTLEGIAAGAAYTCARESTGAVRCSGLNDSGQLGDGTTDDAITPVQVSGGLSFASVTANEGNSSLIHTCGVTDGDDAYCWGNNDSGELGAPSGGTCSLEDLTVACSTEPVAVSGGLSFQVVDPGGGTLAGGGHTCGLTTDGRIFCWGHNNLGQLGDGTTTDASSPVEVTAPPVIE